VHREARCGGEPLGLYSGSAWFESRPDNQIFNARVVCLVPASASILPGLLFEPEDLDDMFLRNVGLSLNQMTLQPRETILFKSIVNFRSCLRLRFSNSGIMILLLCGESG
jgi:hypothetical protein